MHLETEQFQFVFKGWIWNSRDAIRTILFKVFSECTDIIDEAIIIFKLQPMADKLMIFIIILNTY